MVLLDVIEDCRLGSSRMRALRNTELQNASVAHAESTILNDVDENSYQDARARRRRCPGVKVWG